MSDASRLKLCRNNTWAQHPSKKENVIESNRLSLTVAGSSTKAAFGNVSAGGLGRPVLDVTQSGGGPSAFVASQSGGNAGGVMLSKFSTDVTKPAHGEQRPGLGRIPATVGPIAMAPVISSTDKTRLCNRVDVRVCFRFLIVAADIQTVFFYQRLENAVNFLRQIRARSLQCNTSVSPADNCERRKSP